jgi:hypothetical protein
MAGFCALLRLQEQNPEVPSCSCCGKRLKVGGTWQDLAVDVVMAHHLLAAGTTCGTWPHVAAPNIQSQIMLVGSYSPTMVHRSWQLKIPHNGKTSRSTSSFMSSATGSLDHTQPALIHTATCAHAKAPTAMILPAVSSTTQFIWYTSWLFSTYSNSCGATALAWQQECTYNPR